VGNSSHFASGVFIDPYEPWSHDVTKHAGKGYRLALVNSCNDGVGVLAGKARQVRGVFQKELHAQKRH
jgi:hypothetical protein